MPVLWPVERVIHSLAFGHQIHLKRTIYPAQASAQNTTAAK
jgi:hypothetical protein